MSVSGTKKLNIGCGTDIRLGWVNLDSADISGVDVVHDIEKLPLPFEDNTFDEILCQDVLEHVEYIPVLQDLHRILKPDGEITIQVPHFTSRNNFIDPTHKKRFSINTFDFFANGTHRQKYRSYYFKFSFESLVRREITFELWSPVFFYNHFARWLVNKSRRWQEFYEATFLSRLLPACNISVTLRK